MYAVCREAKGQNPLPSPRGHPGSSIHWLKLSVTQLGCWHYRGGCWRPEDSDRLLSLRGGRGGVGCGG